MAAVGTYLHYVIDCWIFLFHTLAFGWRSWHLNCLLISFILVFRPTVVDPKLSKLLVFFNNAYLLALFILIIVVNDGGIIVFIPLTISL